MGAHDEIVRHGPDDEAGPGALLAGADHEMVDAVFFGVVENRAPDIAARDARIEAQRTALTETERRLSEHQQVVYDLDIEARAAADRVGLAFARTEVPNADPAVMDGLARLARSQAP